MICEKAKAVIRGILASHLIKAEGQSVGVASAAILQGLSCAERVHFAQGNARAIPYNHAPSVTNKVTTASADNAHHKSAPCTARAIYCNDAPYVTNIVTTASADNAHRKSALCAARAITYNDAPTVTNTVTTASADNAHRKSAPCAARAFPCNDAPYVTNKVTTASADNAHRKSAPCAARAIYCNDAPYVTNIVTTASANNAHRKSAPCTARAYLKALFIVFAFAGIAFTSCSPDTTFDALLLKLDELSATQSVQCKEAQTLFEAATRQARQAHQWLSLLKRASIALTTDIDGCLGPESVAAARMAVSRFPHNPTVLAGSAYVLLRAGWPEEALALFGSDLAPEKMPNLWAEAFISYREIKTVEPQDLERLADILDLPNQRIAAALAAFAHDDKARAQALLVDAIAHKASVPLALLWDAGLFSHMHTDSEGSSYTMALLGDAAWRAGLPDNAAQLWEASIAADPGFSWKPYLNLALIKEYSEAEEAILMEHFRKTFLQAPESEQRKQATLAFAQVVASEGKLEEARQLLVLYSQDTKSQVLELATKASTLSEDRLMKEVGHALETQPGNPDLLWYGIELFFIHERYDEFAFFARSHAQEFAAIPDGVFVTAALAAAEGRLGASKAILLAAEKTGKSFWAEYARATIEEVGNNFSGAMHYLESAIQLASSVAEKKGSLKALGKLQLKTRDYESAAASFSDALQIDPGDSEAALLLREAQR